VAVFDTGPIDNRAAPRTTRLTVRLFNTDRLPALAGIEVNQINPPGDGFGNGTLYVVNLVHSGCLFIPDTVAFNILDLD
jgi:hypothetical protein